MIHFIYETTNLINGKFYRGKHSTNNLNDGYLGSGSLLKKAIAKYGKDNFTTEILAMCDSESDAYELEELAVTIDDVNDPMCYNLSIGGGGAGACNRSEAHKKAISDVQKGNTHWLGRKHKDESKKLIALNNSKRVISDATKHKHMMSQKKKPCSQYTLDGVYVQSFLSTKDAGRFFGNSGANIHKCCSGVIKKSSGFIWKFDDE